MDLRAIGFGWAKGEGGGVKSGVREKRPPFIIVSIAEPVTPVPLRHVVIWLIDIAALRIAALL